MPCFVERIPPKQQGEVRQGEKGCLLPGKTRARRHTHTHARTNTHRHTQWKRCWWLEHAVEWVGIRVHSDKGTHYFHCVFWDDDWMEIWECYFCMHRVILHFIIFLNYCINLNCLRVKTLKTRIVNCIHLHCLCVKTFKTRIMHCVCSAFRNRRIFFLIEIKICIKFVHF